MTFQKGRAPNPDGRKIEGQVKRAVRAEGPGCIAALATVRDDATAAPEVRAQAAMRLLDIAKWPWKGDGRTAPTAAVAQHAKGGF